MLGSSATIIHGINFTAREIDIIACIVNGRSTKSIALLLNISTRTVSVHISNIAFKIGGNFQEQIARFIEESDCYRLVHDHYIYIISVQNFERTLVEISKQQIQVYCNIYVLEEGDSSSKLINDLKLAGVNVTILQSSGDIEAQNDKACIICSNSTPNIKNTHNNVTYFTKIADSACDQNKIIFTTDRYFCSFLEFIDALHKNDNIKNIIMAFKTSYKQKLSSEKLITNDAGNKHSDLKQKTILVAFVIIISVITFIFKNTKEQNTISNISVLANNAIIERKNVIGEIDKSFEQNNIKISVIVGEGGIGKTTIARKYLLSSNYDVAWEINSESEYSIRMSLSEFANALTKSKTQQDELLFIRSIRNQDEQISRLLIFISDILRDVKWILCYDNVMDFNLIKNYLPFGVQVWRHGRVIITTRNSNIKNINIFNQKNIVHICVLNDEEKRFLFFKILNLDKKTNAASLKNLLNNIPAMPLDICAAAHYIKNTHVSYDNYFSMLKAAEKEFDDAQAMLLAENIGYSKTRYSIITSNLKNILTQNSVYKKLMTLTCLLDSQNIPKSYLKNISSDIIADQFIHDLRKHSLISENNETFSIHRTTQEIGLQYLTKTLSEKELIALLDNIVQSVTQYDKIAWFLYENCKPQISAEETSELYRHLLILNKNLKKMQLYGNKQHEYITKTLLAILHTSKYIKSENEIISLAETILALNKKSPVLTDIDLAVLLEIHGSKYTYLNAKTVKESLEKCLDLCESTPSSSCIKAICLSDYAHMCGMTGDILQAFACFEKAMKIVTPSDCFWKLQTKVTIFNRYQRCLSSYYVASNELQNVIKFGHKLLKELNADKLFYLSGSYTGSHAVSIFMIRRNISAIYNRLGNVQKALENILESKFFLQQLKAGGVSFLKHESTLDVDYGCALLRNNQPHEAIKMFSQSINIKEKIDDKGRTLYAFVFRAEALIRLNKLDEALNDCLVVLKNKDSFSSNSAKCLEVLCLYNIAIIKYKQNDFKSALQNFDLFFKTVEPICRIILTREFYSYLEKEKTFAFTYDISQCLEKSAKIFTAIYGKTHPFVTDYVATLLAQ